MRSINIVLVRNLIKPVPNADGSLPESKDKEPEGYLKLQIIDNNHKAVQSLKVKIHYECWDEAKQRVTKSHPDYKTINALIEAKLKEAWGGEMTQGYSNARTLLDWAARVLDDTLNWGSKMKLEVVINKMMAYLDTLKRKDLSFSEFSYVHVQGFMNYCLRSGVSKNSTNHYAKMWLGLLNKAEKANYYVYPADKHPYRPITFQNKKVVKKVLSKNDIIKLMYGHLPEGAKHLHKYRQYFIWCLMAQGMRVSDLQLIRWGVYRELCQGKLESS